MGRIYYSTVANWCRSHSRGAGRVRAHLGKTDVSIEQFQASREWCDDLKNRFPEDVSPGSKGWLYCGGRLWIEDATNWPEDAPGNGKGRWYVRIGNLEYQSDELADCERPLYDFAKSSEMI